MTGSPTDEMQAVQPIYAHTAAAIQRGVPYEDIAADLVEGGLDGTAAAIVIGQVAEARREAGLRDAKIGGACHRPAAT